MGPKLAAVKYDPRGMCVCVCVRRRECNQQVANVYISHSEAKSAICREQKDEEVGDVPLLFLLAAAG